MSNAPSLSGKPSGILHRPTALELNTAELVCHLFIAVCTHTVGCLESELDGRAPMTPGSNRDLFRPDLFITSVSELAALSRSGSVGQGAGSRAA